MLSLFHTPLPMDETLFSHFIFPAFLTGKLRLLCLLPASDSSKTNLWQVKELPAGMFLLCHSYLLMVVTVLHIALGSGQDGQLVFVAFTGQHSSWSGWRRRRFLSSVGTTGLS